MFIQDLYLIFEIFLFVRFQTVISLTVITNKYLCNDKHSNHGFFQFTMKPCFIISEVSFSYVSFHLIEAGSQDFLQYSSWAYYASMH